MSSRLVSLSFLFLTATVVSMLTSVNLARGDKPAGTTTTTPAAFAITDLGSPRYRNWHHYWGRAYGINEPDSQGLNIIGWDDQGSAEWEVAANGVVSRSNLRIDMKATAVNDNGLIVGALGNYLFANVPGVGVVVLPGSAGFSPAAVNNLGHVVSQQQQSGYPELGKGAKWTIAADGVVSGPIDLGNFRPLDINNWGEVVGYSTTGARWLAIRRIFLSTLGLTAHSRGLRATA